MATPQEPAAYKAKAEYRSYKSTFDSPGTEAIIAVMSVDLSEVPSIEARVKQLDVSLFDPIGSQTSPDDRRSMLAIHAAVSARLGRLRIWR